MMSSKTFLPVALMFFVLPAFGTDLCGAVNGTISATGNPYIATCDLTVAAGTTLTIEEGVEIRFASSTSLNVDGGLLVNGSEQNPVTFTSNQASPAAGDWNGISVWGESASVTFRHSTLKYHTDGLFVGASATADITDSSFEDGFYGLTLGSINGTIARCNFTRNQLAGINFSGADFGLSVSDCVFDGNAIAAYLNTDSYPALSGLVVNPNHFEANAIRINMTEWTCSGTLTNPGCPYILEGGWDFATGAVLTLEKGVVIKNNGSYINTGDVVFNGTVSEPVILTSYLDDSVGGDTYNDGPTEGATGDWGGLTIVSNTTSSVYNTKIRNAAVGVKASGLQAVFDGLEASGNGTGMYIDGLAEGIVRNSDFIGNEIGVRFSLLGSIVTLGDLNDATTDNDGANQFVCNETNLVNQGSFLVMAENNWWGESPYDASKISGLVDPDPYLTSEIREILKRLELSTSGTFDIRLSWETLGTMCGYRMLRSEQAGSGFSDISGLLTAGEFIDTGAMEQPGILFYTVKID